MWRAARRGELLGEADRERPQGAGAAPLGERDQGAGVQAAGQQRAERHVGVQAPAGDVGEQVAQAGDGDRGLVVASVEGYLRVIARAAAGAGIEPARIGYVEAHGNAAPAGDTVELQAIGAAIGAHRPPGQPYRVGSVKTNLGHAEAAGGLAGLVKTALALRHRTLPASLHGTPRSTAVDWAGLNITPVPEQIPWPDPDRAIAGVDTYGLSGIFVHLLLTEAPAPGRP